MTAATNCETCGHVTSILLITDDPEYGLICEDCLNPQEDYRATLIYGVQLMNWMGVEVTPDQLWDRLRIYRNSMVSRGKPLIDVCVPRSLYNLAVDRKFMLSVSTSFKKGYQKWADAKWGDMPDAGPEVGAWMAVLDGGVLK